MDKNKIINWLRTEDDNELNKLWAQADKIRQETVGPEVHLRGLIEISNYCARNCLYCGIRVDNRDVSRYRMEADEILQSAAKAKQYGYGTVVMQAGEDYMIKADWLAQVIKRIKDKYQLAVTLSMGERSYEELKLWKDAGADRYLIRFETSDRNLFNYIHPTLANKGADRIEILKQLKNLGYETGSGVMVGIPGQTYETLAEDIMLFAALDLDMIGVGPFIPHPDTPLGQEDKNHTDAGKKQVPATALSACKTVALTRILCPESNIPSTTALATIDSVDGRKMGLARGANVIMPNLTPEKYRRLYEIYPSKASSTEQADETHAKAMQMLDQISRPPGKGPGNRQTNTAHS